MKKNSYFQLIIITILAIAYGLTIAPGLSWANGGADGGDLITATAVNGVPHPTGYPVYLLIAKVFQLLPVGNLAFRTNLLSTICTILAALLVYQTIFHFQKGNKFGGLSATIAALSFGLSPLIWSQAVISEVYGLQSLLTIVIIYQTIRRGKKPYDDYILGILFGLALGNHITTIFLMPLIILDAEEFRFSSKSPLLKRLLGILIGAIVYIILPLRAANNPALNWLNPVNLESFLQLVSGQIYQSYFSFSYVVDHARAWAGFLIQSFGILGILIGIFAILDSGQYKGFNRIIAWVFFVYGFFALFYASKDSYVYLIQTLLAFCLWIGLGSNKFIDYFMDRWHKAYWIFVPLLILLLIFQIISTISKVSATKDNRAEIFGKTVFDSIPEKALVFTNDDPTTFALWYFHFALKQRPDTCVIAQGLLQYDWYRQSLQTTCPFLKIPKPLIWTSIDLINHNTSYPSCFIEYQDSTVINCGLYSCVLN
jgi:hypothetical protein